MTLRIARKVIHRSMGLTQSTYREPTLDEAVRKFYGKPRRIRRGQLSITRARRR